MLTSEASCLQRHAQHSVPNSLQHSSLIERSVHEITPPKAATFEIKDRCTKSCSTAPPFLHASLLVQREGPHTPVSKISWAEGIDCDACTGGCFSDNMRSTQLHTHHQSSEVHDSGDLYAALTVLSWSCSSSSRATARTRLHVAAVQNPALDQ